MIARTGQPYDGRGGALPEGTYYAWCGERHELTLVERSPSAETQRAVTAGDVEIALVHEPPVLVVLTRVAGIGDWREAPFCWHLLPRSDRVLPRPLREGENAMLDLALVRAEDGIVAATGWMTLDPAFSWVLHRAIGEEAARSWNPLAFHHAFEALRARYPTPDLLLDLAVPCRRCRIEGKQAPSLGEVLRTNPAAGPARADPPAEPPAEPEPSEPESDTEDDTDDTAIRNLPDPGGC